jgi:hypothetical protein
VNRLPLAASTAAGALVVSLAASAFTLAPVSGSRPALSGRPARSPATVTIQPGQPMIRLPARPPRLGAGQARLSSGRPRSSSPAGPGQLTGRHTAIVVGHRRRKLRVTQSVNWSGYAVTRRGRAFRSVRATFFVPYLNCPVTPRAYSANWVGLDGFYGSRPDSVEQDGVEADCVGPHGKTPRYRAWYELYPKPERVRSMTVRAGDSVTASVSFGRRRFRLTVTDHTSGHHFSVSRSSAHCPRNSAQVISEAPANGRGQLLPLADYGATAFSAVGVTDGSGSRGGLLSRHWRTTKIIQYSNVSRKRIAQPTAIHRSAFANYWRGQI